MKKPSVARRALQEISRDAQRRRLGERLPEGLRIELEVSTTDEDEDEDEGSEDGEE